MRSRSFAAVFASSVLAGSIAHAEIDYFMRPVGGAEETGAIRVLGSKDGRGTEAQLRGNFDAGERSSKADFQVEEALGGPSAVLGVGASSKFAAQEDTISGPDWAARVYFGVSPLQQDLGTRLRLQTTVIATFEYDAGIQPSVVLKAKLLAQEESPWSLTARFEPRVLGASFGYRAAVSGGYGVKPIPGHTLAFELFAKASGAEAMAEQPFASAAGANLSWLTKHIRAGLSFETPLVRPTLGVGAFVALKY